MKAIAKLPAFNAIFPHLAGGSGGGGSDIYSTLPVGVDDVAFDRRVVNG